jgi:hypothetical protein
MNARTATSKNTKLTMSPIPVVHTRIASMPSSAGGNMAGTLVRKSSARTTASDTGPPGTLLLIAPKDRFDVEEGFGVSAPKAREMRPPPLLALNAQFVKPYEPPPVQMDDEENNTETQLLFKKDLEGIKEYQEWIAKTVDPALRVSNAP